MGAHLSYPCKSACWEGLARYLAGLFLVRSEGMAAHGEGNHWAASAPSCVWRSPRPLQYQEPRCSTIVSWAG